MSLLADVGSVAFCAATLLVWHLPKCRAEPWRVPLGVALSFGYNTLWDHFNKPAAAVFWFVACALFAFDLGDWLRRGRRKFASSLTAVQQMAMRREMTEAR